MRNKSFYIYIGIAVFLCTFGLFYSFMLLLLNGGIC